MKGLGSDIIEIDRIAGSIERHGVGFLNRLFTPHEQDYCQQFRDPSPHYAARFAAKEAIVKAFGTGISADISWLDIEIQHDERGKPIALFSSKVQEIFDNPSVEVSLSHCKAYAMAVAVWR